MRLTPGSLAAKLANHPKSVLVISALILFMVWPRTGTLSGCPQYGTRYGIMMDAGSTGSRTHVFEFQFGEDGSKKLIREVFEQLKPGLSNYKDDPKAAADSLRPLMDIAVKEVPEQYRKCTPLALKATAGLRLIGHEKSEAILYAVEKMFHEYPFHVTKDAAVVMDGKDEGPYAWLTVNFLLGTLDGVKQTAATFDMGGGSTQVVFVPDDKSLLDTAPLSNVVDMRVLGKTFRLYTHSYLGLGLKEAGKSIKKLGEGKDEFPCFDEKNAEKPEKLSFAGCLPFAKRILKLDDTCKYKSCSFQGVYQPDLKSTFSGDYYVFSYFYDRMEPFMSADGKSSVGEFKEVGQKVCASEGDKFAEHNKGTMCMDFAFLYSILKEGYRLDDSTPLYIKKKINGIETAWALGAMLVAMP